MKKKVNEKLHPRFYVPYNIVKKVGEFYCELDLLAEIKIHNVFHVSCLKKEIGRQVVMSKVLHSLDNGGNLVSIPKDIFQVRERRSINRIIKEYLM